MFKIIEKNIAKSMRVAVKAGLLVMGMLLVTAANVLAQQQGRIIGTVVEARSGEALQGITVVAVGTLYATVTDAEGQFVLGPMPAGLYTVAVNALGFRAERQDVDLAAEAEEQLAFRLRLPEVEVEEIDAAALRRALQPMDAVPHVGERNVQDTSELVRTVPGADAARHGALDVEPIVRGLRGHQVGIYVEGIRFLAGNPYGFDTPLSAFDPQAVATIEVVKGPYALTWGAGMLSAIRMTMPEAVAPGTRLRSAFQAGYTTRLSAFNASGALAGASGKASYRVHGAYWTGDDYNDGSGQSVPADFKAVSVRGHGTYRFRTSSRFVVQAGYQDRRDMDATGYILPQGDSEAADFSARFQTAWAAGPVRAFEASLSWNQRKQTLERHEGVLDQPEGQLLAVVTEQQSVGGRLAAQFVPIKGWRLEVGSDAYSVDHDAGRLEQVGEGGALGRPVAVLSDARITTAGFFTEGSRDFGRFEAQGAVRVDVVEAQAAGAAEGTEAHLSGALALTTALSSAVQVSVGLGSVVRAADAYERYAVAGPFRQAASFIEVTGTPDLVPERSTQADLWVHASRAQLDVQVNAFVRSLSDHITIAPTVAVVAVPGASPVAARFINSKATFYGGELLATYALLGEFATMTAGGSYLWGQNDKLDEPAVGVTPLSIFAGGRLSAPGNFFFLEGLLRRVFKQTRVASSLGEIPTEGYFTADMRFGVSLPRSASLLLGVDNLFGKTYAHHVNAVQPATALRIAEPGRVFYVRVRWGG